MRDEISRRTLLLAIVACVVLIVAVTACAFYYQNHHQSVGVSAQAAEEEFAKLRARFAGQQPLVDMNARAVSASAASMTSSTSSTSSTGTPAPIRAFHTVIFDTRGGPRLIHMTAPYIVARMFAHRDGRFRWLGELTFLDDTEFDPEPIVLSMEDVKRRGPGLIVDYRHPSGGQFLAWAE